MRVSVTVPTYNSAETLRLALASLSIQTYDDWECIVVDDGSDDHTEAVVMAFGDPRFRYIRHAVNQGAAVARQTALDTCRGEFICMLDADDWCFPERLAILVDALDQNPNSGLVSSEVVVVDSDGKCRGRTITASLNHTVLGVPVLIFPACMIRRTVVDGFTFDPSYRRAQDKVLLTYVSRRSRWQIIPDVLYCYMYDFVNSKKASRSYLFSAKYFFDHRQLLGSGAYWRAVTAAGKSLVHGVAAAVGTDVELAGLSRIMTRMSINDLKGYAAANSLLSEQLMTSS